MALVPVAVPFPTGSSILDANFQALVSAIQANTAKAGTGDAPPSEPKLTAPSGLAAATNVEFNGQETIIAVVLSWAAKTGASSYILRFTKDGDSESYSQQVFGTTLRLAGLKADTGYSFQVAAVDKWGRIGAYATAFPFTTPVDTTPPSQVTGVVVARGVRTLIIRWDAIVVSDLQDYEVQVATDAGFTAVVDSWVGQSTFWQFEPSAAPALTTTYHIRVRARDVSGNQGNWSTTATSTLGPGSSGLGSLVADEISTGTLYAVVTISGSIKTAATGQRVEMDSTGLRAYRSDGTVLANLKTSGSPVFELKTDTTGASRIVFSDTEGGIVLYDSADAPAVKLVEDGLIMYTSSTETTRDSVRFFRNASDANPFAQLYVTRASNTPRIRLTSQPVNATLAADSASQLFALDEAGSLRAEVSAFGATDAGSQNLARLVTYDTSGGARGRVIAGPSDVLVDTASSGDRGWLKVYKDVQGSSSYLLETNGLILLNGANGIGAGLIYLAASQNVYSPDIAAGTADGNVAASYDITFPAGTTPRALLAVTDYSGASGAILLGESGGSSNTGCEVTIRNVHTASAVTSVSFMVVPILTA